MDTLPSTALAKVDNTTFVVKNRTSETLGNATQVNTTKVEEIVFKEIPIELQ